MLCIIIIIITAGVVSDHSQAPALTVRDDRCAAGPRNACVHTMGAVASLLPTQGERGGGREEGGGPLLLHTDSGAEENSCETAV